MQLRARALEKRRLPDELDRMLTIASRPAWLGVLALAMAIAGLVAWGFTGNLPRQVPAAGVLSAGTQSSVQSTVSGQVARVAIQVGDQVRAGQPVLSLVEPGPRPVAAPFPGRVTSVDVAPGQVIRPGTPLYTLGPERADPRALEALVFHSGDDGATITPGMKANVTVASAPAARYGVVRGHVASVASAPASTASLNALLGNPDLAASFSRNGPPVVARIRLDPDRSTRSGLRWSTRHGPPFPLQPGVGLKAQIIQTSQKPADVLFGS